MPPEYAAEMVVYDAGAGEIRTHYAGFFDPGFGFGDGSVLGTKVVMVNPYLEPGMKRYWVPSNADSALFGTDIADYWFPVAQAGDIAFLSGVLRIFVEERWLGPR